MATEEFARKGYSGARVDEIAIRTRTTKRMIYYYFGGKEGLYIAVLERAYAGIRDHERRLEVGHLSPTEAIRRLAELTFDYDTSHPEFMQLVSVENIHGARHLAKSNALGSTNVSILDLLDDLLEAGRASGEFHTDATALEVHLVISALCTFQIAHRASINAIFDYDMAKPGNRKRQRQVVADAVVAYVTGAAPSPDLPS